MKTLQLFSDDYLERCKQLTPQQTVKFLEDFRLTNTPPRKSKTRLISIKVETELLEAFKTSASLDGVPYQSRIKKLMREWLVPRDQR